MQGLHHQQQQLAALLSAALPKDSSSSSAPSPAPSSEDDDSSRIAAVTSLHRAILYPPNSLLVTHSASFLAQGFSQLLSDKSYLVRQEVARTYGALCAVLCSIPIASNGRQNHVILGTLVERFINWALPLLKNSSAGDGPVELALESLHEFLNVGDMVAIERYALRILKACQELLEDERTSLVLLHRLLGVLTFISLKFFRCFQNHFVDIVDLLLGWAMVPDLAESDRRVIMDSFLQFQKHWMNNLQFSLGLLSKFLGDMDVLLQDGGSGTRQHCQRLLALLSCFSTVLQATASGLLEMNLLEQITEPLSRMLPPLLNCLSMLGKKFGWSKWIGESWRCLTLLAEILSERFSNFYPFAVDILFQSLEMDDKLEITSFQVHGVLKTNLQLLSLQKFGLLPAFVRKILQFDTPISQLRLHPNHLVTGSCAATYIFLLQHAKIEVVEEAMKILIDELQLLKGILGNTSCNPKSYLKSELHSLIKFDLKVLLTSVSLGGGTKLIGQSEIDALYSNRSMRLVSYIMEKLNPFDSPIQGNVELQVTVMNAIRRLTAIEFLSKCSIRRRMNEKDSLSFMIFEYLRKYTEVLVKALDRFSPLAVKLESLIWIHKFCENIVSMQESTNTAVLDAGNLLFAVLDAASDSESTVRSQVASVLEMLLRAKLIHQVHLYNVTEVALEKLGDPDEVIKDSFVSLLAHVLPVTVYVSDVYTYKTNSAYKSNIHWKQLFSLKQLPHQLHSQQLVSILSYVSQRWKVPLSSWIQRLIHTCRKVQVEDTVNSDVIGLSLDTDEDILERVSSVNLLAGAWWAIHEAARYCITTRLRTNLGGPTQTFAALERMLLDIAHVLHLDTEQTDEHNLNIAYSSNAHLLPLRLLLDFVEGLKKYVYNAYEGSTVLPSASRQSSLFFRANKKVCEEWFSRICEPMMNAGLALQCHDATIHYCSLRLHELKNLVSRAQLTESLHTVKSRFAGDISRVLRHLALSLCKNREPEALIGLHKWAKLTFFPLFAEENHEPFSSITGLVYVAQGQYEKAAVHFDNLLQIDDSLGSMGSDGVQFAITRVIESYTAICDWKSLESWLSELQTLRAKHAGKTYSGALTVTGNEINAIHALARFDEGDFQAAWGSLDLTPKTSSELTLDPKLALQRSEQMLLQAMLLQIEGKVDKVSHETHKAKTMMEEIISILPLDGLAESAPYANQLHCIFAFQESCKPKTGSNKELQSLLSLYINESRYPINRVHQDCDIWLKVLRVYKTTMPNSPVTLKLCKNVSSLARKQGNLMLANRLNNYLQQNHVLSGSEGEIMSSSTHYEGILLLHAENKVEEAFTNLWSFVQPFILNPLCVVPDAVDNNLKAKACLKISEWLKQDHSLENAMQIILTQFNNGNFRPNQNWELIVEEVVGTTTKLSSLLCPNFGKSWLSYGSWCYNQARASLSGPNENLLQSCSFSPVLHEVLPRKLKLTEEEVLAVQDSVFRILRANGDDHVVQQVVHIIESLSSAPGTENSFGESLSETLRSQLAKCLISANVDLEQSQQTKTLPLFDDLVEVFWSLRRRKVSLFGHAARAYINYLSCSSSKNLRSFSCDGKAKQKTVSYTLRATLYLLNMILNFGMELKDSLESELSRVPLLSWQEITPQLFARLSSHPEQVVRKQLEGILLMLAKLCPRSIVYPTLVNVNAYEDEPSEELQHVLSCLKNLYPRLIQDVQLMIKELENVTVLWEELWLSTLQDLQTDVMRRVNLLKEEAKRIEDNITLSRSEKNKINAAKYSAMMAPIVVALERRLASTSRKPETAHESWFHKEYTNQIKSAITNLKTPPSSTVTLADVWRPFDLIASSLASYQRKSSISLSEVAPQLALLSSSDVPMPGLTSEFEGGLTILSFSEQVVILSTKTKPKKIVIKGSDGGSYTYLLKGREDLRLDARIMQLLQAINGLLQSSPLTRGQSLGIRYYSVTPISGRAGLIQWVDNVISIYSVFKSWQTRVQLSQLSASDAGNAPPVPRPSDMFYGKIIPALKEKGIRRVISRRDWPHEVKRKVLLDLMKEAPKELLYQELWCASEGFRAFSSKLKRYSGSVAAMSIVGHILGLGDRHLDNILMDFVSGDIVHIDYNVCFDKGQRLKIPEIVPFRLTQTIEAALGITGVEGTFRMNCEAVLGVLRKNKDILLMLLEVFVWDPLVEWTRGDFHDDAAVVGEERKGMELAVSLSLFASRVQEIRVPLQEHHDLLLATLPAIESALERFTNILNQYEIVSAHFYHTDQEKSNLVMHENTAKSTVLESKSNSEKARLSFESHVREFSKAKSIVAEKAQEAANWIEQNGKIVDALRSNSIPEVQGCIDLSGKEESLSLTAAVSAAGVPLTIVPEPTQAQCHDIDTDVSQYIAELDNGLSSAVTALQTYSLALQRILPLNYLTTSPVHSWQQILQLSVNSISSDILSLTRRQAADLINKRSDMLDSVKATYNDMCLKVEKYGEEIDKVEQECEELAISIGSETELRAKERLLSAFIKYMKLEEKKEKILTVLNIAVSSMYRDVKHKILDILNHSSFGEFEEQVEKCVLVSGFVNDLQQHIASDSDTNWASIFQSSLLSCKSLICQMTDAILPDVVRSVIAFNSEVMDAFGALSQIRGSIDTALDQLIEVESERSALLELEQNYFLKVGRITERQLALEEASVKGRDHLSWEEAEELASQEEACREQLGELHQTWNRKDIRTNSMIRKESSIKNALLSAEHHFNSLTSANLRSKALLVDLVQPFADLELLDKSLSSFEDFAGSSPTEVSNLTDLINSGCSVSEYIWKFSGLLRSHSFFIWKVCVIDSFLDSCMHNAASSAEQNLGFDQFVNVVKKRLEIQLQQHIDQYLKQRVAPILLARLEAQIERMKHFGFEEMVKDFGAVNRVKVMLDEYCNAHETVKAAKSAASLMKKQGNELKEALLKTSLDMIQMKWMHNVTLSPKNNSSRKFLASNDKLLPVVLNLDRSKLLENIESSVSKIKRSIENLQSCERNSVTAEGQLERAMGWACGGPNSDAIPSEFKEHLMRRRQLLWEAREKSSDVIKVCTAVLEFEASRDGVFRSDAMTWQRDYLSALSRLDVTYQSYTRSEQEWKLAQSNMEAASDGLFSASNELCIASAKAKSASGDLQSTLVAMKDCASEASLALAAFCRVTRSHTALTSECGSMLEEVLAITEGLHDVHSLGKEASALQSSLMEDLSKASSILVPLESVLSKDVTAMSGAMTREKETKMEISPIHGQAIYQSYNLRIKEAFQTFRPLLPSLTFSIKGLHSMLTRLARTASLHAGNLHKALEGLGESQEVRSQDTNLSRADLIGGNSTDNDDKESDDGDIIFSKSQNENGDGYFNVNKLSLQEKGWISPPDSVYSSSSESSCLTSADEILGPAEGIEHLSESEHADVTNADSVLGDSDALESLNLGISEVKLDDAAGLIPNKIDKEIHGTSLPNAGPVNRVNRGKNAYALSVLRRVEMKLDGRDITDKREISVAEQVDNLLKQATSVDNLCNMYEGWTPWI